MKTTVVHCKKKEFDVYIGRPSIWGNPFSHLGKSKARFKVGTRRESITRFKAWIKTQPDLMAQLKDLRGKVLGYETAVWKK